MTRTASTVNSIIPPPFHLVPNPVKRTHIFNMHTEIADMTIARVFKWGKCQAIVLPQDYRIHANEVEIERDGESLTLRPVYPTAGILVDLLSQLPEDFIAEDRVDEAPQIRDF